MGQVRRDDERSFDRFPDTDPGGKAGARPSPTNRLRVLILEDVPEDAELMVRELRRAEWKVDWQRVDTEAAFVAALEPPPAVILSDHAVPGFGAPQALALLRARSMPIPLIVVTGSLRDEAAVECMKLGAADYLLKDRLARLPEAVAQALEQQRLREERRLAEDKVRRLNRVYAVLSGINSLIVRVRDRQELLREACRIAVEHGRFPIAWIGVLDHATLDVTPLAWAGIGAESLARMNATARSDVPEGNGVMGRAIRARRPVFDNDIAADQRVVGARRRVALRRGYRSLIALPLFVRDQVFGTLSLYAAEPDFFTAEELRLLTELAGDISFALEYIAKEERLAYLAYYDVLTGLPNRALFHERLTRELHVAGQKGTSAALVLGDVRRLRYVNELLGRQVGDALLRDVAARLKRIWPEPDNVARIAADCFAGILPEINDAADVAHLLANTVSSALAEPFVIDGREFGVSITAGIAIFPADGKDADVLFRNAEAALNNAKKAGERYLFYQPAMNARVAESLAMETKLRRAIDSEQFVLHYQPKVELATGRISGLEGLIRWNDPGAGPALPAQFVPILEDTTMILEAGQWAIHRALRDYELWRKIGLEAPRVAVNVSTIQLRQENFVDMVRGAIEACGGAALGLDLEITESMIMEDVEGSIEKLRALRGMGISVAIDDFGTGYSSLGYLARLPVNALKIDRSFILTMTSNPDSMAIVSTIISLAHSLNLKVVAEGVDSETQSTILRLLKCDEIQGFLVSKPLPAEELSRFLREYRAHA